MKLMKQRFTPILTSSLLVLPGAHAVQSDSGFTLEEVVVTARKREESLQDTPVAVSAFDSNELKLRNISSTDQLGDVTPNLTFDAHAPSSGSNSSSQIFIRGVGQTDFTAVTDPGVGLYVDGIYYARSIGGSVDFLDLERIEILRGPQGTLFGRNTIGGAVSIHTKRPAEEFSGSFEAEVGDDRMRNFAADINVPLTDTLLSKISLASRKRDGYVERNVDGKETGDDDVLAGRLALQWTPSDSLDVFFTADFTKEREQGAPGVSLGLDDQATFVYFTNGLDGGCPLVLPPPGPGFPPPRGPARDTMNDPSCLNFTYAGDEYETRGTGPIASELDAWGTSLTITWDVNENFTVKSITGYRDIDSFSQRDADNSEFTIFHTEDTFLHDQFSQEIQFSGVAVDGALNWLVGLYYFEESADNENPVHLQPVFSGDIVSGGKVDNDNFAAFAQATWDVTDQLHITAGIRFTDETKRFSPYSFVAEGEFFLQGPSPTGPSLPFVRYHDCPTGAEPGCGGFSGRLFTPGDRLVPEGEVEEQFDDVTPMLNVAYDVNNEIMVYFNYSEGFKSGGFDQRFNQAFPAVTSFAPEFVNAYELGMKSTLLDGAMRLNVALFRTDYEDQQLILREGFAPVTFNAGESKIEGAELELSYVPTDAWLFQASLGYIDAGYEKLDPAVFDKSLITLDSSLPQTPEWSANLGVAYTTELGSWGTITPRVDWTYKSESYNDASNAEILRQGSYHLVNATISFVSADEVWEIVLSGRNLNSELYLVTGNEGITGGTLGYAEGIFSRQTEWALSAKYNF